MSEKSKKDDKDDSNYSNNNAYEYYGYDYNSYYYDPAAYAAYYQSQQQQYYDYSQYHQHPESTQAQQDQQTDEAYAYSAAPKLKSSNLKAKKVDLTRKIVDAPLRSAGGEVWQDPALNEWDPNDFRLFCGNLGPDVNDVTLTNAFKQFKSFQKAKVIRDKRSNRSKGYGFVGFKDVDDYTRAFRDINGKYIGSRPVKLSKSNWKDRNVTQTTAKKIVKEGYMNMLLKK